MLTHWGSATLEVLHADLRRQPELALRLLGAWGVGGMLLRDSTAAGRPEEVPSPEPPAFPVFVPRRTVWNPFRMPVYRFVPRVSFHPSYESALYVARGQGFAVDRQEHCVRPAGRRRRRSATRRRRCCSPSMTPPGGSSCATAPRRGGFFVVATTYDAGWRAAVDGAPRPRLPDGGRPARGRAAARRPPARAARTASGCCRSARRSVSPPCSPWRESPWRRPGGRPVRPARHPGPRDGSPSGRRSREPLA